VKVEEERGRLRINEKYGEERRIDEKREIGIKFRIKKK
jgi:hypothetical protein